MTPERLETFQVPRPDKRFFAFMCVVMFVGLGIVGNEDYRDQKRIEVEKRQHADRQAQTLPAPIYSRRCIARGQDFIAHQADGGQWTVHCVGKPART